MQEDGSRVGVDAEGIVRPDPVEETGHLGDRRDAVGAERTAALSRARSMLYALHQQLRDAVNIAKALQASAIPTLEEALEETTYAFERGRYGYLELVDAQREYLAVQSERIDASALAQTLAVEIERLTNAPLAEETP